MMTRREMLNAAAIVGGAALLGNPRASAQQTTRAEPPAEPGSDYPPVFTPNGATLAYRIVDGVKVFHLIAEEIAHDFAPGLHARLWGYNGRSPGPTIEVVEGDRVRFYVTNRLPAPTTVHWHGLSVPNGMDGVNGLTQEPIPPNATFKYQFTVQKAGTFMYHPHFDEMTQQAMGMMGMFIVHPRQRPVQTVDRDYAIMLGEWRIVPGTSRPVTTEMTDFNILTMNSKVYPATQPLVAKLGERVRIRFGNLSATDHHPIHLHGFQMLHTESDGGFIPESARYAVNSLLVPVGSTRSIEFVADNPGDWAVHCHMTHHTMNQMGHDIPNLVGADLRGVDDKVQQLLPGYMTMGQSGMGDMAAMRMSAPPNSIPMLGGKGPFGAVDMGGMFTIVKVRASVDGYTDPGDYAHPPGTVAVAATAEELKRDGIQ